MADNRLTSLTPSAALKFVKTLRWTLDDYVCTHSGCWMFDQLYLFLISAKQQEEDEWYVQCMDFNFISID